MLENIDLSVKVDKAAYKQRMADLSNRLYFVQQGAWAKGIPVIILFEGWDAAGKGTTIHALTDPIDPRGYKIYPIRASRTYEKKRPWLWRFWLKIPARGEWAIFDRSWYGRVLVERMLKIASKAEWNRAYRDIVDFERNLADDGTLIIKFFLHISKKEQRKRFKKLEKDPLEAWRVTEEDWENHKNYKKWLKAYEEMLEHTDTEWGPWTIIEATDKRHTRLKVYETIINALEERLGIAPGEDAQPAQASGPVQPPANTAPVDEAAVANSAEPEPLVTEAEPPQHEPGGQLEAAGLPPEAAGLAQPPASAQPGGNGSSEDHQDHRPEEEDQPGEAHHAG